MTIFRRLDDGTFVANLDEDAVTLLDTLAAEVRAIVQAPPESNRAVARLFPRAYLDPTEEVAEKDWQSVVHDDLVLAKIAAIDEVRGQFDRATRRGGHVQLRFDTEQAERFVRVLNDIRLALGAALGVEHADDAAAADVEPQAGDATYHYRLLLDTLGGLQGDLVDLLLEALPEYPDDEE